MSDRVSRTILLCEDELHERLVREYMKRCRLPTHPPYLVPLVASRLQRGGNVHWVLQRFPEELHACRQRQKKAETLLIVVIDADQFTVDERRRQLDERLRQEGYEPLRRTDPVVLLIPRRHVETWLHSLLGETLTEEENCKDRDKPTKDAIRQAADTAYEWARENAPLGPSCVPSLRESLPGWRKIG